MENQDKCYLRKRVKNPSYECRFEKVHEECIDCPYNQKKIEETLSRDLAGSGGGH